jgi:hypothetical protein
MLIGRKGRHGVRVTTIFYGDPVPNARWIQVIGLAQGRISQCVGPGIVPMFVG